LLATLPSTPEQVQQELTLQVALGGPMIAMKGYAAPEVERIYTRARVLCQQVGETPQLFPVLRGLLVFNIVRGQVQTAYELAEQLLRLAQSQQDPAFLMLAYYMLGLTLVHLGAPASAHAHLAQTIALYNFPQHRSLAFLYGVDVGVASRIYAAWALWMFGYPDQALQRSHEALTLAREVSHPYSLALALDYAAYLHQFRREGQAARERAEEAITLATEQGFPFWLGIGTTLRGWALAAGGEGVEGTAQMRQGLSIFRTTGSELMQPYLLALLAETCAKAGQTEAGLVALAEALAVLHTTGERFYEAELYRLKGELLLQQAVPEEPQAEACFRQALDVACWQQAKSLELRAAMSLSRLWQRQGRRAVAHALLAPIYGWFTEGFDTVDLQEARMLLDALA
jgi:predicted ATPase